MGDGDTVVGHGDALGLGLAHAPEHLAAVEHATAAVDHEVVAGKVLGEAAAGGGLHREVPSRVLPEPRGDLLRPDVAALAVVRAALGDEHARALRQPVDRRGAAHGAREQPLVARHQDREARQRHVCGHDAGDLREDLAVRDHHRGPGAGGGEALERAREDRLLHHDGLAAGVEHVAHHHLLGQDQPSLGGRLVDGDHQDHDVARDEQVAHERPLLPAGAAEPCDGLLELEDAGAGEGAQVHLVRGVRGDLAQEVALVVGDEVGRVLRPEQPHQLALARPHPRGRVHHEHRHVCGAQDLARPLHAQLAQLAGVVEAGGVHHGHRPQGQDLHGLDHRVRRGAQRVRHDREVLAGDGVDHARLARVPPPEEADVHALRRGGVVKTHALLLPRVDPGSCHLAACRRRAPPRGPPP